MRRSATVRDEEIMAEALVEAEKSLHVDEFPVGAVVVLK
jgi:tRNA(Arg) A34 adenosine deaminase TadA